MPWQMLARLTLATSLTLWLPNMVVKPIFG